MRFLGAVLAAALALSPALAAAQSNTGGDQGKRPQPGPLAGRALEKSAIPPGAIVLGGLVLLGGVVIGLLGSSDANNNTNGANVPAQ